MAASRALDAFAAEYVGYFERNAPYADEQNIMLDPLPRWALVRGLGLIGIGRNAKEAGIGADLAEQAVRFMISAERLGRFASIREEPTSLRTRKPNSTR
jgi:rhamnose utilization protein RhaD (predicted bifunctional aldolase and dehydrogenase)